MSSDLRANVKTCTELNHLTSEQVQTLRTTVDKSTIVPTDDLKCYTKCVFGLNGFFNVDSKSLNVERLVEVSKVFGREESIVRDRADKCQQFYDGSEDCDKAWDLYVCMWK